jgi:dipeptidyl aminopeptidase/acylaminoacyl peptidase
MPGTLPGFLRALPLILLGALLTGRAAQSADPPGAEIFGALAVETGPALSPDGQWLAWIENKAGETHLVIFNVAARKVQRILGVPEHTELRHVYWHSNETLLLVLSDTQGSRNANWVASKTFRVIAADVSGGEARQLASPLAYLVAARTSKPYTAIMATGGRSLLLEVDTRTGRATTIKAGNEHTVRWFVNRDGRPLAREDWNFLGSQYRVYALYGDSIKEILRRDDSEPPRVGGVLDNDLALLLLDSNGHGHQAAWALPLDGSPRQLLVEVPDEDITQVWVDPYSGEVAGVYVSGADSSVHWLQPAAKARYESLARAFPNRIVEPYGWTNNGSRTLARVSAAALPPVYYLTDFKTHKADIAAEEYPALATATLGDVKEISYKARDGTDIPAYLTMPPGRVAPVPLVVLPHGGPDERDYPMYNWIVQFLATHGYAVLQPQFRGSSGFGEAFRAAGDRQWGGLMQDDLTDGVTAMAARGGADPRRVCIVGTSPYGGYAALAGATLTPDLYSCAVSINGIADLPALKPRSDGRWFSASQSAWKQRIGEPHGTPIKGVKSVKAPILIMYGPDPGVPPAQALAMADALRGAGKSVTVVQLPSDAEWWMRGASRVRVLQELERFLAEHLREN